MAEFLGIYDPAEIRHCITANAPHGLAQKMRARITTRRAWTEIIYSDCSQQRRIEWHDSMPPTFAKLTDDYALAALMMWTY
eukprot:11061585-Heterocapsa_arctica.AAC.1